MKQPQIKQFSIRRLHRHLAERIFAVPKLQREFVWDGRKAATLLDSIFRNMPIGSILVWETKRKHFDLLRQNLHILPTFNTENTTGWFLIDGQQRLSVIHEAFEGSIRKNSTGKEINFGRICFVLQPNDDEDRQSFVYRKPVTRELVPVKDILSANWRDRLSGYPKHLLLRIERCRKQLLAYRVPIVFTHSEELEEIREIFLRINAQGIKIGAADRAFARASKVELRELAHELRAGVNPYFRDIDFTTILQGFAFVTTEREIDVGQRALDATVQWWENQLSADGQQSKFYQRWSKYRQAFGKAIDHLHSAFNCKNIDFLPSTNMPAALAVFFFYHSPAPDSKQRKEINKWFWATAVGQRYSGRGYRTNLIEDVKFFERLANGGRATFNFKDYIDPQDIQRTEYTNRSALANAYYCLLAGQNPCYFANGEPIPPSQYASRSNRSDRHHIFPKQLLATHGLRHKEYNSLCNICFVAAEENQKFGMKRPDRYLDEFRKKLHFSRAMKSHLIPTYKESGLFTKNVKVAYKQFCKSRLKQICSTFEKEAGIKLFRTS
jgi:hypothetical protein